jgi:hypothetical protein
MKERREHHRIRDGQRQRRPMASRVRSAINWAMPSFRRSAQDDNSQSSTPRQHARTRTRSIDPSVAVASVREVDLVMETFRKQESTMPETLQMDAVSELPSGQGVDLVNGEEGVQLVEGREPACAMDDASSAASATGALAESDDCMLDSDNVREEAERP